MSEAVLRVRQCRACKAIFYVCSSCDRGNATVVKSAESKAGEQQLRAANRRYKAAAEGRQAHLRRQRQYRFRRTQA
jgi:hypothetical protein